MSDYYTDPETGVVYCRDSHGILLPRVLTDTTGKIVGYEQAAGFFPDRVKSDASPAEPRREVVACTCGGIDAVSHATDHATDHAPDCAIWGGNDAIPSDYRLEEDYPKMCDAARNGSGEFSAKLLTEIVEALREIWNVRRYGSEGGDR